MGKLTKEDRRKPKPLAAIPFGDGPEVRYPNLNAAAAAVVAQGKSRSVATARVSISRVCTGRRWSAFYCDWHVESQCKRNGSAIAAYDAWRNRYEFDRYVLDVCPALIAEAAQTVADPEA